MALCLTGVVVLMSAFGTAAIYRQIRPLFVPETDPAALATSIQAWAAPELTGHFPSQTPEDATNVRFYHLSQTLQGALILQLRVTLPPERVAAIDAAHRGNPLSRELVGILDDRTASPDGGVPFAPNFSVYVTASVPNDSKWHHGRLAGVAVSLSTNEVVYFAQRW